MAFEYIRIDDFRNLTDCEIVPHERINLVQGENGSGKTSFLEAIYILGRGRSFKDKQLSNAVQRGKESFTVFGKKRLQEKQSAIGVGYSRKGASIRIDGERISKLSILAKETPVHIITPKSQDIIEHGSSIRRRFLDWGVFHVEPLYQHFSSRYQRALIQRNRALRELPNSAKIWNRELIESGIMIQDYREKYFEIFRTIFFQQLKLLDIGVDLDMLLYRGWTKDKSLQKALEDGFSGDENRKHTRMGPHRADLLFRINNKSLDKWGSRGQLKLVIYGLFFAQVKTIKLLSNKNSILLIDDLTVELDKINSEKVIAQLIDQKGQIFATTTNSNIGIPKHEGKMFHVEHGVLSELGV